MEGPAYLHFNVTNMVTIWIMVALGVTALGFVNKIWNKSADAS